MRRRDFSEDNMESKGKGKEKEKDKDKEHPDTSSSVSGISNTGNSNPHVESALSRLASSTTNLMGGSMLSAAHGLQSANFLPSGKAESSSIAQHLDAAHRETAHLTHTSSPSAQSPLGTTFRSTVGQGTASTGASSFSEFLGTAEDLGGEQGGSSPDKKTAPLHIPHAVAAAMNDGSEVVDLLQTGSIVDEDSDGLYMTSEELLPLRRALLEEGASAGTSWDSALNFVPEFILNRDMGSSDEYQQLAQHLGLSNAAEARDVWFNQWDNVLSSYTVEVWGDLNPLVMAARQELKAISTTPKGTTSNGLSALRRLQQILAHVRGPF
ncbi:hypothetical protein F4801DRAFT_561939 [Xylaria longipes]|nr:hypothetical protein F4801DRAFT_561939 [Xylaria longipes]RYC66073.1 hypothetical protein CHU98_g122 [Xylaria longipes]